MNFNTTIFGVVLSTFLTVLSVKIYQMKYLQRFALAGALFIGSCSIPKPLVYKNINHFGMEQANLKNTVVSMDLNLYNPNKYNMKLKNADVEVYINEHYVGKAMVTENLTIPKLNTFSLPILLRVDLGSIIPNAIQLLISNEITLKLTGLVKAGRHGIYIKIPLNYEGKQKIR